FRPVAQQETSSGHLDRSPPDCPIPADGPNWPGEPKVERAVPPAATAPPPRADRPPAAAHFAAAVPDSSCGRMLENTRPTAIQAPPPSPWDRPRKGAASIESPSARSSTL